MAVDEKNFTVDDFKKTSDNMIWVVDFDVANEKILAPMDVLAYTSQFKGEDYSHTRVLRTIKERYHDNHNPLFTLFDFYQATTDFETATLAFHTKINADAAEKSNTVITNENVEVVDTKGLLNLAISAQTHVFYEILDAAGAPVNAEITPLLEGFNAGFEKVLGDYFVTNLAKGNQYKIRVNYTRGLADKELSNRFDVRCINAVPTKDRLITGTKGKTIPDYSHLGTGYQAHLQTKFAGYDVVTLTCDLEVGDYIKVKLDCGSQLAYSELQINII